MKNIKLNYQANLPFNNKVLRFFMASVSVISVVALNGCTPKNREEKFTQGQGQDLATLADYDNKFYSVETFDEIGVNESKDSSVKPNTTDIKKNSLAVNSTGHEMVSLPFVKFSTNGASLLKDIPFKGRPNTKDMYQILYRLTDKYLKIYKVAAKQNIDKDETSYAETLEDGRLAVPLMGYKVSYIKVENVKNADGEQTKVKSEYAAKNRSEANAIRIDFQSATIFEALAKTNVFKSDYFVGDWFYSETIVATPAEEQVSLGFTNSFDQNLQSTQRVKFVHTEALLKVVNLNVDDRIDKSDDINLATVLSIPIKWKQYQAANLGTDKDLKETEVTTNNWSTRPYIEIEFDHTKTVNVDTSEDLFSKEIQNFFDGTKLVGLELTDDYFSFVLHNQASNNRIRYSFMRAGLRNYKPKVHFEEDFKKFGYFTTKKAAINNFEIRRKQDVEKNTFISRFNPERKTIEFRFTRTSPLWVRPSVVDVINEWNKAFKSAGTTIDITIRPEPANDVDLGDVRYNIINIVESLTEGNLFGLGPSLTDPMTGEIISATSNVHVTPIRSALVEEINSYIKMKTGQLDSKYSAGIGSLISQLNNIEVSLSTHGDKLEVIGSSLQNIQPTAGGVSMKIFTTDVNGEIAEKNVDFKKTVKNYGREFNLAFSSGFIHREIENHCPEIIKYIEDLNATKVFYNSQESEVLNSCSKKLTLSKMKGTLIHELGHNFGLRHNFYGSNDAKNFYVKGLCGQPDTMSSSVMEYPAFNQDRLTTVGCYDIAAIRYGYSDSVELENGKIAKLDTKYSIAQQTSSEKVATDKYKFCTDEDVYLGIDPMCQRHDAGLTPEQVVDNLIAEYNTSIALLNYRFDKIKSVDPNRLAAYRADKFFVPMKRFYDQWRLHLGRFLGRDNKYLVGMNQEIYSQKMEQMKNHPVHGKYYAMYKPAADKIFNFLMKTAMLPDRYCIIATDDGQLDALSLIRARENIFFSKEHTVINCDDSVLNSELAASKSVVLGEAGQFLTNIRFDLSPQNSFKPFDVIGIAPDRALATFILTQRAQPSIAIAVEGLAATFLDEAPYRQTIVSDFFNRALKGVDTKSLFESLRADEDIKASLAPVMENGYLPKFWQESNLVLSQLIQMYSGLGVPERATESAERRSLFSSFVTENPEVAEKAIQSIQLSSGQYLVVTNPNATMAAEMMKEYKRIRSLESLTPITQAKENASIAQIKEIVPEVISESNFTVAILSDKVNSLMQKAQKDPNVIPAAQIMTQISQIVSKVIQSRLTEAGEDQQKIDAIGNLPVLKLLEEAKFPIKISQDFLVNTLKKQLAIQEATRLEYVKNKVDYEAKVQLLIGFLLNKDR